MPATYHEMKTLPAHRIEAGDMVIFSRAAHVAQAVRVFKLSRKIVFTDGAVLKTDHNNQLYVCKARS